jgi:hypothetical protein
MALGRVGQTHRRSDPQPTLAAFGQGSLPATLVRLFGVAAFGGEQLSR